MIALNPNHVNWDNLPEEPELDESSTPAAPEPPKRKFAHVDDWVNKYLIRIVRRRLNEQPGKGLSWDSRWWLYPEVVARMMALHDAWEEASAAGGGAMSRWWVNDLEPHLRVILDGDTGPMSHASMNQDFSGHPPMPVAAMPEPVRRRLARAPEKAAAA